jgi:hypothetical protein
MKTNNQITKMKTITICEYPQTFTFKTKKVLPPFTYGCEIRTKLAEQAMKRHKIDSPCHGYNEYVVEDIKVVPFLPNQEYWYLGS